MVLPEVNARIPVAANPEDASSAHLEPDGVEIERVPVHAGEDRPLLLREPPGLRRQTEPRLDDRAVATDVEQAEPDPARHAPGGRIPDVSCPLGEVPGGNLADAGEEVADAPLQIVPQPAGLVVLPVDVLRPRILHDVGHDGADQGVGQGQGILRDRDLAVGDLGDRIDGLRDTWKKDAHDISEPTHDALAPFGVDESRCSSCRSLIGGDGEELRNRSGRACTFSLRDDR